MMLDIEESTSRSQYTRAKAMLEDILLKKRILPEARSRKGVLKEAAK
jgi:RNA polymerase sigma-70 factor (ECF subfamily)